MTKQRNIISLPDRFWTAIDNVIDGELINTRGDALIHLLSELERVKPESIKTEEMVYINLAELTQYKRELVERRNAQAKPAPEIPQWITSRKWLNEKTLNTLVGMLGIADDTSETGALIAIDSKLTAIKIGEHVGNDGLRELRRIRAEKKKAEAEGAQA